MVVQLSAGTICVETGGQVADGDDAFGIDEQTAVVIVGQDICAGQRDGLGGEVGADRDIVGSVIQVDAVAGCAGRAVGGGGNAVEGDSAIGVNYQPRQPVGAEYIGAGDGHTGQRGEIAAVIHIDAIAVRGARCTVAAGGEAVERDRAIAQHTQAAVEVAVEAAACNGNSLGSGSPEVRVIQVSAKARSTGLTIILGSQAVDGNDAFGTGRPDRC